MANECFECDIDPIRGEQVETFPRAMEPGERASMVANSEMKIFAIVTTKRVFCPWQTLVRPSLKF